MKFIFYIGGGGGSSVTKTPYPFYYGKNASLTPDGTPNWSGTGGGHNGADGGCGTSAGKGWTSFLVYSSEYFITQNLLILLFL